MAYKCRLCHPMSAWIFYTSDAIELLGRLTKKIDSSFWGLTANTFFVALIAAILCVAAAVLLTYTNRCDAAFG